MVLLKLKNIFENAGVREKIWRCRKNSADVRVPNKSSETKRLVQ